MFRSITLGALCLLFSTALVAQSQYFWSGQGKQRVTPVQTEFIISADNSNVLQKVGTTDVVSYESWPHSTFSILETKQAMTTAEVITSLGFAPDQVQVIHGYVADGMVMYPTRTVLAKLNSESDRYKMDRILSQYGVASIELEHGVHRIRLNEHKDVFAAANELQESGLVQFAHPNFYAEIEKFQINDPLYGDQFQMNNTGATIGGAVYTNGVSIPPLAGADDIDCDAPEAWAVTLGSDDIVVAIIDDGVEDHEDLEDASGVSRLIGGYTPLTGVPDGNGAPLSGARHGEACAGSIAASHNSIGVRGVAPLVKLLSVDIFFGGQTAVDIADGFSWAMNNGADVISNSWGYGSDCSINRFPVLNAAMADANANGRGGLGCVIIFSAGNSNQNCVSYPGNADEVISVGAIANDGQFSSYTSRGPRLDLCAPSSDFRRLPSGDVACGVTTTDRMGAEGYSAGNYTTGFGGTSSACPLVAGVAALLLGDQPGLTSEGVKQRLYVSATDMGAPGFDNFYAWGRVNAFDALMVTEADLQCINGIMDGDETGVDCGGSCGACPPPCTDLTLTINADNFGSEISWNFVDENDLVVTSGNSYPSATTSVENICLPDGCYTFTIFDSFGDGICCAFGEGSYTLELDGMTIASGSDYDFFESTDFCIEDDMADMEPPSTPVLTVSNETDNTADLSWTTSTDNVGVMGYMVYANGSLIGDQTGTTLTATGLAPCTINSFEVVAYDMEGNSSDPGTGIGVTTGCLTENVAGAFFETGWDGWIDGGSDSYRYSGARSHEGSYSIRLRDNSGEGSSMTSADYDVRTYSEISLSFWFYAVSFEQNENFTLEYNGGNGWELVEDYGRNANGFFNEFFYDASVTLSGADYPLTDGARFRFTCDASTNGDQVYIDEIIINGLLAPVPASGSVVSDLAATSTSDNTLIQGNSNGEAAQRVDGDYELHLSPNPTSDVLIVEADEPMRSVSLLTIEGKLMIHRELPGVDRTTLVVSDLPTGIYLVSVLTEEEVVTERVVIRR